MDNLQIIDVCGIFAPTTNNNGVLLNPKSAGKTKPTDPYVPKELVQRFNIKKGQFISGKAHQANGHQNPKVRFIETIDAQKIEARNKGRAADEPHNRHFLSDWQRHARAYCRPAAHWQNNAFEGHRTRCDRKPPGMSSDDFTCRRASRRGDGFPSRRSASRALCVVE